MSLPERTPYETIRNAQGERLDYACAGPEDATRPFVVIGHGVTANKDRAWARTLAQVLHDAGVPNLRFSFSGNGESEGDFRESTVTKEVADLGAVLDVVCEGAALRPLIFVGHSMGGAVGVLRAATDERITGLVSLAGMVHTHAFAQRKFGELTPGEDLMWDKPECPLSAAFMDDMARIDSVLPRAAEVRVPWLLVHGTGDTVVPHSESVEIQAAAVNADATLVTLEGADHLFSGDDEGRMAVAVAEWVRAR